MTPRRSSRARTSQPSPALLQHTLSNGSSNPLSRGERSTRSNHKIPSPQRSSTQRSQSLDDPDGGSKNDFPQTRQRQRARDDDEQDDLLKLGGEEDEEEEGEEEEITRCLCGQQDYPGLPPSRRDALGRSGINSGFKDESAGNSSNDPSEMLPDDIGSMFIQCDSCKVWQHGGCVGIMDEAMSPDEYFCEECRKDLHKITNESNGQHSSQYLPVVAVSSPASSSRDSSRDNSSRRTRDSKPRTNNDNSVNTKRRSTMNSRDAAYDEEEQLRRAIEESKEDTKANNNDDMSTRRGKRSRSDSETNKQTAKRQRTSSPSPSSLSKQSNSASQPASDDESKAKAAANGNAKKQRGAATRNNQREKETKETDEAESERAEAAGRRKGRSDRRKGDADSDQEMGSPVKTTATAPEPSQPSPDASAPAPEPPAPRPSTRKTGRPPARRGGRLGRNQYTRDRDTNGNGFDTNHSANSPRRGQSHDTGADSPRGNGNGSNGIHVNGGESGRPSKPRYMNPHRTTMNEMKRRVAAILEFISRMQVEMAVNGESSTPTGNGEAKAVGEQLAASDSKEEGESAAAGDPKEGVSGPATDGEEQPPKEKDFKDLSSVEMMDVLTRHLLKWQQEYGKYGEK
ncbi:hypothetical protein VTN02DRAFT_1327 [Thermoascus thermophilus]